MSNEHGLREAFRLIWIGNLQANAKNLLAKTWQLIKDGDGAVVHLQVGHFVLDSFDAIREVQRHARKIGSMELDAVNP